MTLQGFNSVPVTTLNFQQGRAAGGSVGPNAECRTEYGSAEKANEFNLLKRCSLGSLPYLIPRLPRSIKTLFRYLRPAPSLVNLDGRV